MSNEAVDGYIARWRDARPERGVAWLFLHGDERARYGTLATMEQEWLRAVHEVTEPQVGLTKLGWWREELQRALRGGARHPLTVALFADVRARRVPLSSWLAPVDAAAILLSAPAPANFAAQCAVAEPLAEALSALEAGMWFGRGTASPRAARAALLTYLVENVRALAAEVAHGRSPVPMNLLARHGLTRESLTAESPARRTALADYVAVLGQACAEAARMAGPLGLFRAVSLQCDRVALHRAETASDPLVALRTPVRGIGSVLKTWRAARAWRAAARPVTDRGD